MGPEARTKPLTWRRAAKIGIIVAAMMAIMLAVTAVFNLTASWYSWLLGLALSLVVAVESTRREEPQ